MKVFDFDNTLYHGESAVDFAIFMIRSNKKIILWLPRIIWNLFKYKMCIIKKDKLEIAVNSFLRSCMPDQAELMKQVRSFWSSHEERLDYGVISRISSEDAVVTAGPGFLLKEIINKLGTDHLICSEVDIENKKVVCLNFSDNKVRYYRERFGDAEIDSFYTDSYNDQAMMDISKEVFLVDKGNIKKIK